MDELKEIVTKTLEKQGVLAKIRAELRASVFQAIEDEEGGGSIARRADNPRLRKLLESPNGVVVIGLIREFMAWAGLSFSVKVFDPEVADVTKMDREAIQQRLGLHGSDDAPLIGALLESFLSRDSSGPLSGKIKEGATPDSGLRGPRPDPLTVTAANPALDKSQSDMSDVAASPYDVTTPSSAFLGQDDLPSVKRNTQSAVTSGGKARGRSPLGGRIFDTDSSQELDKTASFEMEDDGIELDDADIQYDDDLMPPLPSDDPVMSGPTSHKISDPVTESDDLLTGLDSIGAARLDSLEPPKRQAGALNPLDKPLLAPLRGSGGALAPLGKPLAAPRKSSDDIKQDLLRQGLISPGQSPSNSQEFMAGNIGQMSASADLSETSVIPEEVSVVSFEEIDAFSGGGSDNDAISELSYGAADTTDGILGMSKGGASMEFFASGLSASDRSGELDALGDADYFESAEIN